MFEKVLIANRGEVALRVLRACKEMGIQTVAVHSTADSDAMHVRLADESVCIGPPAAKESYLNIPAIISAATITNANAIHPGYGFLAENAKFAEIVGEHGFTFIGPSPEHIALMGDKIRAKAMLKGLGMPVVPGSEAPVRDADEALEIAERIGYPVMIKAAAGGGGKGMKLAESPKALGEAFHLARAESRAAFGSAVLYLERYLVHPRHIEIQIVADNHGHVIHLGERDCSLQRNHQKLLEEAPSPALNAEARAKVGALAVDAMRAIGYRNLGTLEFLHEGGQFYFIEMNPRLQVEHPVSEMISGLDLVREQIRIASEAPLSLSQDDVRLVGHAIECRVNAENPETFAPSPGTVGDYHVPGGLGVRVDSALYAGYVVPPYYDSLIAKIIVHANSRNECLLRLRRALDEYVIDGIETTLPLHRRLVANNDFINGNYDIHWLERFVGLKR
jgi:acetyl-CoA carboxylase, biotin carboxylase subunit